ncbi:MAG: hypothetical protein AB8D78_14680 [Akkermansiaceae bacterium]
MRELSILACLSLAYVPLAEADFTEKGGIVAMEAESTDSRLGKWKKKQDVEDFRGECHLEFTGNKTENGPPKSPLKYSFRIHKGGVYRLTLRARKRLETAREDISNDCYVAVDGDFEAGGGAPLKVLKEDTKMFGGKPTSWGWCDLLDVKHNKFPALYRFKEGEVYELTISGRSKNFNLDRIIFIHEGKNYKKVQRENPRESERSDGLGGSRLKARTVRSIKNKEGRVIEAQLVSKAGDQLTILKDGRQFKIAISSLSEEDQAFIKEWQP